MARRWLVAAVLLAALGGCGDDPETEPAIVPVPATSGASPVPSASPAVAAATRTGGTAATDGAAIQTDGPATADGAANQTDGPATTSTRADGNAPPAAWTGTDRFVAVVQREMPDLATDRRDDEIATLAEQACGSLAARRSAGAVVDEVRTYGTGRAAARKLIRLAISTVCPAQHRRAAEF